ncbi:MAG: hypothetical protein AMR96_04685 [Candidatus Adiutrix intracellularis]|jgi:predicted negative regulator of RcsB-dependent stress response|nr:MAG: hypothetical protein AMR96_04685 [Candidatus Adiutrix intracellularis]MDR2827784.1 hypothetical protein [Candidatus Adiutrix intracellularis]
MVVNKLTDKKNIRDLIGEKDVFLTISERIYEYFLSHIRLLAALGAVVVLVIIGVILLVNYQSSFNIKGLEAYENALASDAAVPALEKVRADYPGSRAARLAAFSLIGFYTDQRALEKALPLAENLLQTLKANEISIKPVLLNTLGGLYETGRDYPRALQAYQAILEFKTINAILREDVLLALGRVNTIVGDQKAAIRNYEEILQKFPNSFKAYLANTKLAALKGVASAFPLSVPADDNAAGVN